MNNTTLQQKNWWKRHWKWCVPTTIIILGILLFMFSDLGSAAKDISKAYADKEIFNTAFSKVKANENAVNVLGDLQPIDDLAILEGSVQYTNNNNTFKSSTRIVGSKASGKLDLIADKIDNIWVYKLIKIRVKKPKASRQTIVVLDLE
ncbi:cytochrome c oxidase assembly factor Coa1 family protein [Psychroserpens damuponensis]|uniref:cytochrome c oxidase assembly factor Coa1 family protein n=1 Tax=Psychroserpens damuponensis TaxID=943936 RepID=UPI00058E4B94|nr:cytochrome c oxidase assembly factor Coa1 family protein [Psychroserpens damuponensis]